MTLSPSLLIDHISVSQNECEPMPDHLTWITGNRSPPMLRENKPLDGHYCILQRREPVTSDLSVARK